MINKRDYWVAYRLRMKRRKLLVRAIRSRRNLRELKNRTADIQNDTILGFSTVRNERARLPYFLEHHRKLGVGHFVIVSNDSNDGTDQYLCDQPDVSVWTTPSSYKKSRFGMDWLTWLLFKYGHEHWCLTLDADELLIIPHHETQSLQALTKHLDQSGISSFGALMLDMYPNGPLGAQKYVAGEDPIKTLNWFDDRNYHTQFQSKLRNFWVQGGVRERVFFQDAPEKAPTLNKTPLVKWHRRNIYLNSTHTLLPRVLNNVFDKSDPNLVTGALLHTKFIDTILEKSREEKKRQEHFGNSKEYDAYYDGLIKNPNLWNAESVHYEGWQQLIDLGLMSCGNWKPSA